MTAAETVTILRTRGRCLAKTIAANGTITGYDEVKTVDIFEQPIADLEALRRLLRKLEQRWDCCIVRGKAADPERCRGVRRLLYADRETGDLPTLVEVPRRWVALDFDNLDRPDWIEPTDLLGCAVVAIRTLPASFQQARFIVQATASHGLKPGIRLRLWAWLARPVTGSELKYWLRAAPVDKAVFGPAQVIYTARPRFLAGALDPLSSRLDIIPGREAVSVPRAKRLKPPERPTKPTEAAANHNIAGLIRTVENATKEDNRNKALYWAACRVAESPDIDRAAAAADLEQAAIRAGLSAKEAAATVRSGLRHQGGAHA
jgi:hypothetical protein